MPFPDAQLKDEKSIFLLPFPCSPRSPGRHQGHLSGRAHHPCLVAGPPRRQREDRHVLRLHEDHGEREAVRAEVRGLPAPQPLLRPGTEPEPAVQVRPSVVGTRAFLRTNFNV